MKRLGGGWIWSSQREMSHPKPIPIDRNRSAQSVERKHKRGSFSFGWGSGPFLAKDSGKLIRRENTCKGTQVQMKHLCCVQGPRFFEVKGVCKNLSQQHNKKGWVPPWTRQWRKRQKQPFGITDKPGLSFDGGKKPHKTHLEQATLSKKTNKQTQSLGSKPKTVLLGGNRNNWGIEGRKREKKKFCFPMEIGNASLSVVVTAFWNNVLLPSRGLEEAGVLLSPLSDLWYRIYFALVVTAE